MHDNYFIKCKSEIFELISIARKNKEQLHIITIFDDPYNTMAESGMIFPSEIADVEAGFSYVTTNYTGYSNYASFKKDLDRNIYSDIKNKYLVYSTAQIGVDINRRCYIPLLCQKNGLKLLTCDAYRLGLLMDKSHYFALLSDFSHIPQTLTYDKNWNFNNTINAPYVILKPALECAAVGVTKIKNNSKEVLRQLEFLQARFNQKILVQEYIDGYEISVPVIEKKGHYYALPPVWVEFEGDILDFDKVDNSQYSFSVLPCADFPYNQIIPDICQHAEKVMQFIGTSGLTRVDYRIKRDNSFYIFDIAALPVLANTGSCVQSFKSLFGNSESMYEAIIGSCLCQSAQ